MDEEDTECPELSTRSKIDSQKKEASPETGYQFVEWDLMKPPTERLLPHTHKWKLRLSNVSIPPSSEFIDWSVFDKYTNEYATRDFTDLPAEPDPESIQNAITSLGADEPQKKRLALVRIKRIVQQDPEACYSELPTLVDMLQDADLAVQAEITSILADVAVVNPEQLHPFVDTIDSFLDPETHDEILKDVLEILNEIVEADPKPAIDSVPSLAVLLEENTNYDRQNLSIIVQICKEYPDAIVPIVPTLTENILDTDGENRVDSLAALGYISKSYPNVAEDIISPVSELVDAEQVRLRANALGLLADLANEYPHKVKEIVPRAIELLDSTDKNTQYNATSVISRVAKHDPDITEPAIEPLIDALDADMAKTRENACWALRYMEASSSILAIKNCAENDPNERVREIASEAVEIITDDA